MSKKRKFLLTFALLLTTCMTLLAFTGCSEPSAEQPVEKSMPETIPYSTPIEEGMGAVAYDNMGDHPDSMYYVNPDFYNAKSNDHLTILENFKTYQQTSEWSCGNAVMLMTAVHFGIDTFSEWDIAVMSGSHRDLTVEGSLPGTANKPGEYGTTLGSMVKFVEQTPQLKIVETNYREDYAEEDLIAADDSNYGINSRGNLPPTFCANALYTTDNDPDSENYVEDAADSYFVKWLKGHLEADRPIMVAWSDWDGHWQAIIGYDNMGTPGIGDDMLIFADPYDTSDHWQDGYYYYPLERWFYMWHDRNVPPKP